MTERNNPSNPDNSEEYVEQNKPFNFTDKRRIDPVTGEVRDPLAEAEDILQDAAAELDREGLTADTEAAAEPQNDDTEQVAELREDLQRLQAEFVNYRRRVERDRDVAKGNTIFTVMGSLLPVIDDLDAAAEHGELADGPFAAIARKLETTLASHGLVRLDAEELLGTEFNPAHHEAMMRQPSDEVPEEHIVQVFRVGYLVNDRVLRAAQVMVSAGPAQ